MLQSNQIYTKISEADLSCISSDDWKEIFPKQSLYI